tara:strand:- start:2862 stop:3503 length:642 start_codon:yes stop_codon:yes gene_type:complete
MGFLDHSTNNIIVDAVLTDIGREKLAAATTAENFVAAFAFADDEVDYTMIKKYGTIVGKEKIEKNTPIFEASTNAELAVKCYLSTSPNPIVVQPSIETSVSQTNLNSNNTSTQLNISMLDSENLMGSVEYFIYYDSRFLSPENHTSEKVKGHPYRRYITVESTSKEDKTIRFKRGSTGEKALKRISKTKTNTQIQVRASTGLKKRVPVNVEYN